MKMIAAIEETFFLGVDRSEAIVPLGITIIGDGIKKPDEGGGLFEALEIPNMGGCEAVFLITVQFLLLVGLELGEKVLFGGRSLDEVFFLGVVVMGIGLKGLF